MLVVVVAFQFLFYFLCVCVCSLTWLIAQKLSVINVIISMCVFPALLSRFFLLFFFPLLELTCVWLVFLIICSCPVSGLFSWPGMLERQQHRLYSALFQLIGNDCSQDYFFPAEIKSSVGLTSPELDRWSSFKHLKAAVLALSCGSAVKLLILHFTNDFKHIWVSWTPVFSPSYRLRAFSCSGGLNAVSSSKLMVE